MRVAVLGMGRMGRALAGRLLDAGHEVRVWNRTPGRAEQLVAAGAREATSVAEAVTGVQVALTMVADDEAVRTVALGSGGGTGLLDALPGDAVHVDASTVAPSTSGQLAAAAGAERFVAMPVLGSPAAVSDGTAAVLLGGAQPTVGRLEPLWGELAGQHRYVGTPEQALTLKLAANLLLVAQVAALGEAITVARGAGLSTGVLREFLAGSPLVGPGVRNRLDALLERRHEGWWTTTLAAKDARLAADAAQAAGHRAPVARFLQGALEEVAGRGLAEADLTAIIELTAG
jgi:3-hydroxyisobutyrate dehydrogenase-like beta-hydroxyacid dehydrogenase